MRKLEGFAGTPVKCQGYLVGAGGIQHLSCEMDRLDGWLVAVALNVLPNAPTGWLVGDGGHSRCCQMYRVLDLLTVAGLDIHPQWAN